MQQQCNSNARHKTVDSRQKTKEETPLTPQTPPHISKPVFREIEEKFKGVGFVDRRAFMFFQEEGLMAKKGFILEHNEKWKPELEARKERGVTPPKLSNFLKDYLSNEPPKQKQKQKPKGLFR